MCQNPFFVGAPSKNQIVKMHQTENPCVKGYKFVSKIPCAAGPRPAAVRPIKSKCRPAVMGGTLWPVECEQ